MSGIAACACSSPVPTETVPPAAAATERKYLLERVDDAAVVQVYADGFDELPLKEKTLVWHLYQAAHRRARHLLRPALRAQPRDARRARSDPHASRRRRRPRDARRDRALHQAVLDQHRPVQQPDRAQVRADVHAGGVRRGRARRRAGRRARSRRATARRSTRCSRGCAPMFFDATFDPMVTQDAAGRRRTSSTASANNLYVGVTMKDLERLRRAAIR